MTDTQVNGSLGNPYSQKRFWQGSVVGFIAGFFLAGFLDWLPW